MKMFAREAAVGLGNVKINALFLSSGRCLTSPDSRFDFE